VTYFRYAPTLEERIDEASLVISHAGAGSIFESLRAGKRLIAVPNSALMDNHQEELCVHLQGKGYLDVAAVDGLEEAVGRMDGDGGWMKRYVRDDGRGIGRAIGEDYVRRRGGR
jgi:beta-1,4-N-acetylglucosaminyltransferase